jgi:hypothetical protein
MIFILQQIVVTNVATSIGGCGPGGPRGSAGQRGYWARFPHRSQPVARDIGVVPIILISCSAADVCVAPVHGGGGCGAEVPCHDFVLLRLYGSRVPHLLRLCYSAQPAFAFVDTICWWLSHNLPLPATRSTSSREFAILATSGLTHLERAHARMKASSGLFYPFSEKLCR